MQNWWVYIIEKRKKLYVGITTDLQNRMRQHGVTIPLYSEGPMSKAEALKRERNLKGWRRDKKLALIKESSSQQQ
jgi:putative endonuclease